MPPPVVLVHGIDDTAAVFDPMRAVLERHGVETHALSMTPPNGHAPLETLAAQLEAFIALELGQACFDLVGFSMGGLVGRYYLQRLNGLERVRRFVTISSPHHGTLTALLCNRPACVQMRPGSSFLRDLNRDAHTLERVGFTSIYTRRDLMIVPSASSRMRVGQSILVPVPFHAWMVQDARVIRVVLRTLDE